MVVVLGDLVQQGITGEDVSVTGAATAVSTLVVWMSVGDFLVRRWGSAGKAIEGETGLIVRAHGEECFGPADRLAVALRLRNLRRSRRLASSACWRSNETTCVCPASPTASR